MERRTLSLTLVYGIVAATLGGASAAANAQTILFEDSLATGIHNLRINNLCYDVEFVDGSYHATFADASPTFLNQPVASNVAANEIRDVLNSTRRVPEINAFDSEVIWVPNDLVTRARFQASQVGHDNSTDPWRRFGDFEGMVGTDYDRWEFAVFDEGPSVVYAANTGYAVGIHNMNIDGACLDVRFADGSYDDVFADDAPRYLGLEPLANNVANRIMDILNAESNVPDLNPSDNEVLWIPTTRSRLMFEAEQVGHDASAAPWKRFGDVEAAVATDYDEWDFAVFDESLDCNHDGVVDIKDMNCACDMKNSGFGEAILNAIGSLPGDVNGDGKVSFIDFLKLSGNFGEAGEYTDGDLDCDGMVGFSDFLIQSGNYGGVGDFTGPDDLVAVPESTGWGMVLSGALPMLFVLRRRRV